MTALACLVQLGYLPLMTHHPLHSLLLCSTCTTKRRRWGRRSPGGSFPPTLPSPEWENSSTFVRVVKIKMDVRPLTPLPHLLPPQLVARVQLLGCELFWLGLQLLSQYLFGFRENSKFLNKFFFIVVCKDDSHWKRLSRRLEATNKYFCYRLIWVFFFVFFLISHDHPLNFHQIFFFHIFLIWRAWIFAPGVFCYAIMIMISCF